MTEVTLQNDMFMPQVSLAIMDMGDGQEVMCCEIATACTQYQFVLATKENYRQVADKLAENIRRVGAEMNTPSRLITNVRELPDGLRQKRRQ
jgi:hypothetical protein